MVVSHEVATRGWTSVETGEVCHIPGVGPIDPQVARELAQDAFITGVIYDGKDLRQIRRWTRHIPVEIKLALKLGPPPDFDGPHGLRLSSTLATGAGSNTTTTSHTPNRPITSEVISGTDCDAVAS